MTAPPDSNREAGIIRVLERLDEIIAWSRQTRSPLGYFPALYRRVTAAVKERVETGGFFDDDARMERLDVIFANRYLDAWDRHRAGQPTTRSWRFAFEACEDFWPVVLQHLLLGMNAHINLDLGVAAARTVRPSELEDLGDDFNRINQILADLVDDVQTGLARIWRPLTLFNQLLGDVDDAIINFSMTKAREEAWKVAKRLSALDPEHQQAAIDQLDEDVVAIARVVRKPGILLGGITKLVRLGEIGSVANKIDLLT